MEPLVLSSCIGHTRHGDLTIVGMSTHIYVAIDIVYMPSCRFNEHWDVFLSLLELGDS